MWSTISLNGIKDMLEANHTVGLPIVELQMLEKIKNHCFPTLGPLMVGIDMELELFLLKRDPSPGGDKWY